MKSCLVKLANTPAGCRVVTNVFEGGPLGLELSNANVNFYHNTVAGSAAGIQITAGGDKAINVKNNLIDVVTSGTTGNAGLTALALDYNLIRATTPMSSAVAAVAGDHNKINVNPGFRPGTYYITDLSPAINCGAADLGANEEQYATPVTISSFSVE